MIRKWDGEFESTLRYQVREIIINKITPNMAFDIFICFLRILVIDMDSITKFKDLLSHRKENFIYCLNQIFIDNFCFKQFSRNKIQQQYFSHGKRLGWIN